MDYTLKELLDIPRLRDLLDSLDQLHSLPSAILDTEGNILTATAWQDICTKYHRINPETATKCTESDRHIKARLGERAPHTIYRCPMGLIDAAMPIIIEDQHLGNVFTGQLFLESPDRDFFIEQARKYGFDEEEYLAALSKVPLYSEEKLHQNLNLIHGFTQMLAEQGLQNLRLREAQEKQKYRSHILEMLATDQPLSSILEEIVTGVEHIRPLMMCSVLLLDQNGKNLHIGAAPSLPDFYNTAIDGVKIGEEVGSCGTAAYTGTRVIVDDIMTHPYWSLYKEVAAKAGLAACWSEPIRSSTGTILGTFAIYHHTPHKPTESDIYIIEQSANLASIAIEKKLAAEKLLASEEQHRILIKTAMEGIWLADAQGRLLEVNDAYCRMSGYSEQELLNMHISDLDINESLEDTVKRIADISEKGQARFESQHRHKDGSIFDVEVNVQFRPVNGGQCFAFLRDVTERKQAETALAEQADFTLRVFNSTDANMAVVDHNGIILGVNEAWRRFANDNMGADEKVWGAGSSYFVQYDNNWGDAALAKEAFEGVRKVQNGQLPLFSLEYPCHSSDDQKRWFRLKVMPLQGKEGSVLIAHIDITTRKLAEDALKESRRLLAETEKIGKVGGWEFNIDTKIQVWTEEIYHIHELDLSFIPTVENGINFYTSESRPIIERAVQRAIDYGEAFDDQLEIITAKGNHRYVHAIGNADLLNRRVFGFFQDITERKQLEAYREITREVLKVLNEPGDTEKIISNVISVLKQKTGFSAVGIRLQAGDDFPYRSQDGFSKEFLLRENSIIERSEDGGVCRDNNGDACLECTCGLVISGKPDSASPLFTKGGSFFTSQSETLLGIPSNEDPRLHPRNLCIHEGYSSVALVPIRNKEHIIGLIQFNDRRTGCFNVDTVEQLEEIAAHLGAALMRKQAEEEKLAIEKQFLQAQKLESLGVLAGGIAHDFNNILAVIVGHCSLATLNPQSGGKHIQVIEQAVERAAELCRQMLSYAGKAQVVESTVDVKILVDEMIKMLRTTINKNVLLTYEGAIGLPTIIGDASQIRQIVMNLIINAADAIGEVHGEIRVALQRLQLSGNPAEKDHQGVTIKPGWYVLLEVSDNGCGMTDETRQRIFEPFYTTKFTGRGLGMSAVLGIIKAHGGALQLVSALGAGTTFKVYLPVQSNEVLLEGAGNPDAVESWHGHGTILLVEDEVLISQVASELLGKLGFRVIVASNGREAIELFQKNKSDIDLVVTDLGMPVLDGYGLIRELKIIAPELPIIITSGFGDVDINARIVQSDIAGLISKPYNYSQLRDALKRAVGPTQ